MLFPDYSEAGYKIICIYLLITAISALLGILLTALIWYGFFWNEQNKQIKLRFFIFGSAILGLTFLGLLDSALTGKNLSIAFGIIFLLTFSFIITSILWHMFFKEVLKKKPLWVKIVFYVVTILLQEVFYSSFITLL